MRIEGKFKIHVTEKNSPDWLYSLSSLEELKNQSTLLPVEAYIEYQTDKSIHIEIADKLIFISLDEFLVYKEEKQNVSQECKDKYEDDSILDAFFLNLGTIEMKD